MLRPCGPAFRVAVIELAVRGSKMPPSVALVLGSESDLPVIEGAKKVLETLGVPYQVRILSAHRTPEAAREFARGAAGEGFRVLIGVAGMAAHLPGALSSESLLPVLGVPVAAGPLAGVDALLSIVQMPPGVPVAALGIGPAGALNAALLAAQILALDDPALTARIAAERQKKAAAVLAADSRLREGSSQ